MRFGFLTLLALAVFFVKGQTADSLLDQYLSYPDDTNKVELLYQEAFSVRNTDLPSAVKFARACYNTAVRIKNKQYLAKSLNLTGVLRSETGFQQEALTDLERALQLRIETRDTLSQAIILNNIGNVYSSMANNDRALHCYEQALLIAKSVGDERWMNGALLSMAEMQTGLQLYAEAEGNLSTLIGWAQRKNDYEILGMCYKNMSLCKLNRGDTTAAEAYQLQALDIAEMAEDDILKADALCTLGNLYLSQKNYKEGVTVLQAAKTICEKNKYQEGLLRVWKSLADFNQKRNDHKAAFEYLVKHDSTLAAIHAMKTENLSDLWKEKNEKPLENKMEIFSIKNNIFECVMIGALLLLLLVVLINPVNEQKT